jgi:hypothetical protein
VGVPPGVIPGERDGRGVEVPGRFVGRGVGFEVGLAVGVGVGFGFGVGVGVGVGVGLGVGLGVGRGVGGGVGALTVTELGLTVVKDRVTVPLPVPLVTVNE